MATVETRPKTFRMAAAALSMAALFALSACGGGGGGTMTSGGSGPGPGEGMPGDGTGGGSDAAPWMPAPGLTASAATPMPESARSADDTLESLLPGPSNSFAPVSSALERNFGEPATASVVEDAYVKAVSSDGANGFRVTYVIGAEERTIHFAASDYGAHPQEPTTYYKEAGGGRYWLWAYSDSISGSEKNRGSRRYRYVDAMGTQADADSIAKRIYMVFGVRTDSDRLPEGSATYGGDMFAERYPMDDPRARARTLVAGYLRLTVDFAEGTLAGQVRNIRVRPPGAAKYSWATGGVHLDISDGRIVDGRLTAKWREVNPGDDDTFAGDILGEFYGPGAEEVGGVINGANGGEVLAGFIQARKFELDPHVPQGALSEPMSVAVDRDFVADSVAAAATSTRVTAIESDGADGFRVTYLVEGQQQTVHLEASDSVYFPDGVSYLKQQAGATYRLTDEARSLSGSPAFSHFNVNEWLVNLFAQDRSLASTKRGYLAYGAATEVADLPTGTATYTGRAAGADWEGPDWSDRTALAGDLRLTADFDGGTVDGSVTGIEVRSPGQSVWQAIGGSLMIHNGGISGSRFTADLTGTSLPEWITDMDGTAMGGFYGPAAAEVGGVFQGTSTRLSPDGPFSTVWHGWFGGKKQ